MPQDARTIYWIPWEEPGGEQLSLRQSADGAVALGMILRLRADRHLRGRYEGLFRNITAELPVDGDGLVMDYPETFKRSWPQ
ncbi:MAG: hypothetical protein ACFB13_19120 [Kiloniellaceae bacterium]